MIRAGGGMQKGNNTLTHRQTNHEGSMQTQPRRLSFAQLSKPDMVLGTYCTSCNGTILPRYNMLQCWKHLTVHHVGPHCFILYLFSLLPLRRDGLFNMAERLVKHLFQRILTLLPIRNRLQSCCIAAQLSLPGQDAASYRLPPIHPIVLDP
jgi:hypothetical protein